MCLPARPFRSAAAMLLAAVPSIAQEQWTRAPVPPVQFEPAVAWDSGRGRLVVVAPGRDAVATIETWEWDGRHWHQRQPRNHPPVRFGHAIAYDPLRRRVVMFGGLVGHALGAETWLWDGTDWQQQFPGRSPSPRVAAGMTWDPNSQRMLLFAGGDRYGAGFSDTWTWDGTIWERKSPRTPPPGHLVPRLASDEKRGVVVLHYWNESSPTGDTWEWDGAEWALRQPAIAPIGRRLFGLGFEPRSGDTLLYGGFRPGSPSVEMTDTWSWDGTIWRRRSATNAATGSWALLSQAGPSGELALLGPVAAYEGSALALWSWNGMDWLVRHSLAMPRPRARPALAYDEARAEVVLFGGELYGTYGADAPSTWLWDGRAWQPARPSLAPVVRVDAAMTYDAARARVVMFGGRTNEGFRNDTWEWDGRIWRAPATSTSPPAQAGAAMTYDRARARVVLFGSDGHWEWDGLRWQPIQTQVQPLPRQGAALTYDERRRRVVMFGGNARGSYPSEVWEFDGNRWSLMQTTGAEPLGRVDAGFAYDRERQRVLLTGGRVNQLFFADAWEWDGLRWADVTTAGPAARAGAKLVFEPRYARMTLFGGYSGWEELPVEDPQWFRTSAAARVVQDAGIGCASSLPRPRLAPTGLPRIGDDGWGIDAALLPADAPLVLWLGLREADLPIGPCRLNVDPQSLFATVGLRANAAGFAHAPLPLPLLPVLRGLMLHAQAFSPDPAQPPFGIAMSTRLSATLGD